MPQFPVYKLNPKKSYLILFFYYYFLASKTNFSLGNVVTIYLYILFITTNRIYNKAQSNKNTFHTSFLYIYSCWDRKSLILPCRTFTPFSYSDPTGFKDVQHFIGQDLKASQEKKNYLNQLHRPSRALLLEWFYLLFLELVINHFHILTSKNCQKKMTNVWNILLNICI